VDDEVKSSLIPKMTLQPLVENAIYHGIKNKEGNGKIMVLGTIDVTQNGKIAVLKVCDDGV
jgi:two-component system sensor histidine kinase YesM